MAAKKSKSKAASGSLIPADRRAEYHVSDTKTAGGRKSIDSNDAVAKEMRGLDMDGLRKFARAEGGNALVERFDGWVAKNLNPGQCRMNLGNVIRAMRRNGGVMGGKPKSKKTAAKKAPAKKAAKKAAAKRAPKAAKAESAPAAEAAAT